MEKVCCEIKVAEVEAGYKLYIKGDVGQICAAMPGCCGQAAEKCCEDAPAATDASCCGEASDKCCEDAPATMNLGCCKVEMKRVEGGCEVLCTGDKEAIKARMAAMMSKHCGC